MHAVPVVDPSVQFATQTLTAPQLARAVRGAARLMALASAHPEDAASCTPLDLDSWTVDKDPFDAHVAETRTENLAG